MKKIWTKSVFVFDEKKNKYVVDENESQFHYVSDDTPILEMKGGSGKSSTTTSTQRSEPWGPQQGYLTEGFRQAFDAFLNDGAPPRFSDESKFAQDWAMRRARAGNPLLGEAQGETSKTLSGDYLYGGEGFNKALDAAKNRIIPDVESRFARGGRLNSGLARTAEASAIGDAFAGLYGQERDRMQRAAGMAPGLAQADYFDIAKASEVGSQKDMMSEAIRNDRRNRVLQYLQAISGNYGGTQTGTATTTGGGGTSKSPWAGALGGGIMGGMYGGPWGAAAGAGLGLLSSWL